MPFSARSQWYAILNKLAVSPHFYETTAATYYYHLNLVKLLQQYTKGCTLDLGCGRQTYRSILLRAGAKEYIGLDMNIGINGVDVQANGDALPFASASLDTVFCTQVLEHVSHPWQVAAEIYRVLKPGGHLILTVPFFYFLHDEPYDYYRYTPHGVVQLFSPMNPLVVTTVGGPLGMISEFFQMSILLIGYTLRPLWPVVWAGNRLFNRFMAGVDNYTARIIKLPINVMAVLEKNHE